MSNLIIDFSVYIVNVNISHGYLLMEDELCLAIEHYDHGRRSVELKRYSSLWPCFNII